MHGWRRWAECLVVAAALAGAACDDATTADSAERRAGLGEGDPVSGSPLAPAAAEPGAVETDPDSPLADGETDPAEPAADPPPCVWDESTPAPPDNGLTFRAPSLLIAPAGLADHVAGPCTIVVDGATPLFNPPLEAGPVDGKPDLVYELTYDEAGRMVRLERSDGEHTAITYDPLGDEASRERHYFDGSWSRSTVTWNANRTVRAERTALFDGRAWTTAREWDAEGRLVRLGYGDGGWRFAWQGDRPVLAEQDADGDGLLERSEVYTWDALGRLAAAAAQVGGLLGEPLHPETSKELTYDAAGRLVLEEQWEPHDPFHVRKCYRYDDAGVLREERSATDAETVERLVFDAAGRPVLLEWTWHEAFVPFTSWSYDEAGRLSARHDLLAGQTTLYGWDEAGNLLWEASATAAGADALTWTALVTYHYDCWAGVAHPPGPVRYEGMGCLPHGDARLQPFYTGLLTPVVVPYALLDRWPCGEDIVQ